MLQISKGECQFLYDLLTEIHNGYCDVSPETISREVEEGIEIVDEILQREDVPSE